MLMASLGGFDPFSLVLLALVLDAAVGDPAWLYRAVPHPTTVLGRLIDWGEARLNRRVQSDRRAVLGGAILTVGVVASAVAAGVAVDLICRSAGVAGWLVAGILASSLLAFRGLFDAGAAVARDLEISLGEGREAVRHMAGRDPQSLDRAGVARAAVESVAENFSDGVVAPVFWFVFLGLPGLTAYKAINTLDSMIGHRTVRFQAFGRVAARLDDLVNLVPARLAGLLFVIAAAVLPGADPGGAWRAMAADAPHHRSPNAGWPEAAVAGALGFALGGPRRYPGVSVDDAWMGRGRRDLDAGDIRRALHLYLVAGAMLVVSLLGAWGLSRL
jgi:adenosylcobinamide-phosphate synthase